MKIVFLCPSLAPTDGWNRYSRDIVTRLARQADVTVLCHSAVKDVDPAIKQVEVMRPPMAYLPHPLWVLIDAWRVRRAVAAELQEGAEQYVHATVEGYAMFIPFLQGLSAKTLMTTHGTYSVLPLLTPFTSWLYRRMYRRIDRVISVSEYTKRHLLQNARGVVDAEKIVVVPNGVDFRDHSERLPSSDGVFRILTTGEVKHRKGGHHLVRVAAALKRRHGFPFQVTFVGKVQREKPYFLALDAFVREHRLEKEVIFAGLISQAALDACYAQSDLFALLSVHEGGHYEGYPLVFHEAAMWGLPTLGTFDCGAEDAIRPGHTGFLVHPGDHDAIADLIANIRSGVTPIRPGDCRAWAAENDWSRKNLLEMYVF